MRWPTTLRAQFVAVVAGAVILSNLAVIAILEVGREGELQVARRAAAVDRISSMFDYISTIPEEQRESAMHTLSEKVALPTAGLREAYESCALPHVIGEAVAHDCRRALVNSFAFGGANVSLLLRRVEA